MIPAIFFSVDIQHSLDLAATMRRHGVRVYSVSGKTPKDERKRLVEMARNGEVDGLSSCEALSTGTDIPLAMMAVHARPCASGLWYRQATGRVLRPLPAPQGERKYQRDALVAVYRALQRGVLGQVVNLPTGTGKTRVAATSIPMLKGWKQWAGQPYRGRVIFTVHREELSQQAAEAFARHNPTLRVGIEKADSYAGDADIVIASIQTIGGKDGKRLRAFNPDQFDAAYSDECHFGISSVLYERYYRHMRIWKKDAARDPYKLHCGLTATPNRADNVGLEKHYDEITYSMGLADAIRDGWLCRILGYRMETKVDISKVRMRSDGEDFALAELEKTVNTPERNEMIARKYLEICREQRLDVQGWIPPTGWVKPHAIVLDCADLSGQHSLVSLPTLFGFSPNYNAKGRDVMEQAERVKEIRKQHPNLDLRNATDMDAIDATLQAVDLLAPPVVPPEVRGVSGYAWLPDGPGAYHLGCMDHRVLTVRQNMLGQWEIHEHMKGMAQQVGWAKDLRSALRLAEKSIPPKEQKILPVGARWRNDEPTDYQAQRAWDMDIRIRREYPTPKDYHRFCRERFRAGDARYTKGSLSQLICALDPARK